MLVTSVYCGCAFPQRSACPRLADVATEFRVQGLELNWILATWDADLRMISGVWLHRKFHDETSGYRCHHCR